MRRQAAIDFLTEIWQREEFAYVEGRLREMAEARNSTDFNQFSSGLDDEIK
jgi:hypothetical protein